LSMRKARPQHWYDLSIWNSLSKISLTVNSQNNTLGSMFYINDSKPLFDYLYTHKEAIEEEVWEELEWERLDEKKASLVKCVAQDMNFKDKEEWSKFYEWLYIVTPKLHSVFAKYVKNFQ
jgi:hypothetical protein